MLDTCHGSPLQVLSPYSRIAKDPRQFSGSLCPGRDRQESLGVCGLWLPTASLPSMWSAQVPTPLDDHVNIQYVGAFHNYQSPCPPAQSQSPRSSMLAV